MEELPILVLARHIGDEMLQRRAEIAKALEGGRRAARWAS